MTSRIEHELIERIHASPVRIVLAVTGGGSGAIGKLLGVAGASRTVLEARVPYSAESLVDLLGARPEQLCSARTARAMAMTSLQRAIRLSGDDPASLLHGPSPTSRRGPTAPALAGVASTAGLASDRPKRGPHRAHAAVQTVARTLTASLELEKGSRSRAEEESLAARLILRCVATACGVRDDLAIELRAGEEVRTTQTDAPADWQRLLLGQIDRTCLGRQPPEPDRSAGRVVFPGAFDPLHDGHRWMAEIAHAQLGSPVEFELSIENVDKPPLDYTEIAERAEQFSPDRTLWLTRAATFVRKAAVFPGAAFVVGADTVVRIADPRYYVGKRYTWRDAVAQIADRGCRFLVFGRADRSGFQTLTTLDLPPELREICLEVPAEQFRVDVSSTELRRAGEATSE